MATNYATDVNDLLPQMATTTDGSTVTYTNTNTGEYASFPIGETTTTTTSSELEWTTDLDADWRTDGSTGLYVTDWNEQVKQVVREMMGIDGEIPIEDLIKLYKKYPEAMKKSIKMMKETEKDA